MANSDLQEYFERIVFIRTGIKPDAEYKKMITVAIIDGKNDFQGAFPWAFKEKHDTITTTASSETVDLPSDFEGLISVVEHTSMSGAKLEKYSPDRYDFIIPESSALSEGTPEIYKVYCDDGQWKLALYPTPSAAISLYIAYHVMTDIPDKYVGGLKAAIATHLTFPGSPEWKGAFEAFTMQVERLSRVNSPDVELISHFSDSSDEPLGWSFEDYMKWGPFS